MSAQHARLRFGPLTILVGTILGGSALLAAPAFAAGGVNLHTADSFAVLAGSGITNTGPTTITGDIGTFPTPSETGFGSITQNGTNHDGDAVTQGAKTDLTTAYNDAAGRPSGNEPVELGGLTLTAGGYTSPTFGLTGTLTLDAQGDPNAEFIFQAGSTLITASDSRVLLINGASPCNVVWQIGSSATFGTRTQFVGDVLAHDSITATTNATFQGRLLARGGAVTLDTNTITNAACAAVTTPTPTPTPTPTATATSTPTHTATPTHSPKASTSPKATATKTNGNGNGGNGNGGGGNGNGNGNGNGGGGNGGGGFGGTGGGSGNGSGSTGVASSLPFTGGNQIIPMVAIGLALLIVGGFALAVSRRRTPGAHSMH
jgi:LPXTG-motif cell wall-anchored protein